MHTSSDDYLINILIFVSAKEETQIYGAILPESLTSPEMKETKAYKTYLGFAIGATPSKKAIKFKKQASPQLIIIPVSTEEPTRKQTPEMPLSKKKEKVDVTRGKGIELLSQMALTKDAQFEEVRRKSMRDFHKTHPSGSGAVKIVPSVTSEGTGIKPGVPDVTKEEEKESSENSEHETDENESGSESDQEENEEDIGDDEEEVKDEFIKTPSNDSDDKAQQPMPSISMFISCKHPNMSSQMDYTTNQLYNDVDIRLNEPVDTDKVFVQEEGTDAAMTNIQQRNENPEILQVIEDAHVTLYTVP
ncbi:hypothetical protein Tco_1305872 [Tanacetum coccineum]